MTKVEISKTNVMPREIHVGTKEKDVYKDTKLLELFNYADKNGDKVIDESEMKRCEGPLLTVEKNNKKLEFYPGLELDSIKDEDSEFVLAYRDLDANPTDRVLSKEEIEMYPTYVDWKEYQKNFMKQYEYSGIGLFSATALNTVLSVGLGAYVDHKITQKAQSSIFKKYIPDIEKRYYSNQTFDWYRVHDYNSLKAKTPQKKWDKLLKDVPKGLKNAANGKYSKLISRGIALLGTGAGIYAAITANNKMQEVKKSLDDLEPYDQQYKHIYNS